MNNCRDFILTVFAVLALALPNLVAAPHAWNMFSGSYAGGRGPAWMTLTIQGEQENEEWWFESANFSWDQKNIGSSANVFDDLLKVQRFKVGTTPKIVQFVYRLPKAVLELDTISTTLSVTFRTSGNALVGPISVSESGVDIVKRREFYWDRFAGSQPIVAAYQPGNYLTFDYYGAGLFATLGIASNMGKVQIDLDGVKGKSLDLYPTDLPATANITNSIRTDNINRTPKT